MMKICKSEASETGKAKSMKDSKNNFSSPWPRPGMQGLSSIDYTPEALQLLYSFPAKSHQGRL